MLTTTKFELSPRYHSSIYRRVQSKVKKFTISAGYTWRKARLFAGFRPVGQSREATNSDWEQISEKFVRPKRRKATWEAGLRSR